MGWSIHLFGGGIMPEMMHWLQRDGPVSNNPNDKVERDFRQPVAKKNRWDQGEVPKLC